MTALPLILTVFVACAVEVVEALTIVLAAGLTREWRSTFQGMARRRCVVLAVVVAVLGPALTLLPLDARCGWSVGALLAVFGLQWLRKAILRATGNKELHDEASAYLREVAAARARLHVVPGRRPRLVRLHPVVQGRPARGPRGGFHRDHVRRQPAQRRRCGDRRGRGGARGNGVGVAVRAPLARVPENAMKFAVGHHAHLVRHLLGRRRGRVVDWPGHDAALLVLVPLVALVSLGYTALLRPRPRRGSVGALVVGKGDQLVKRLRSIGAFWYDFVVGDDWRIAVVVVAALALTALLVHVAGVNAWWLVPVCVFAALGWSLRRATSGP